MLLARIRSRRIALAQDSIARLVTHACFVGLLTESGLEVSWPGYQRCAFSTRPIPGDTKPWTNEEGCHWIAGSETDVAMWCLYDTADEDIWFASGAFVQRTTVRRGDSISIHSGELTLTVET